MKATIAAHDLGRTYDCAWPSCPREARTDGGYCDQGHVGTPPTGARGRVEPGSLAHLTDDEPEPVKEPPMPVCKVPGCGKPESGLRGPLQRLCSVHVEEKRAELGAAAKAKWAERHAKINSTRTPHDPTRVEVEAKPPVAAPAPPAAPANGTLAELGRRVDERIARIQALTQEITAERDLLADDVNTFQATRPPGPAAGKRGYNRGRGPLLMPAALFTLRQLRQPKMTLRQLQAATGINRGTLSQIERGRLVASTDELAAIAEALALDRLENRTLPVYESEAR